MAIFYPSLEKISKFKVPPTPGERTLLEFLKNTLDDSFEVFFNPYLNGDRPDVLIMRKGYGVLVIEVKDWNLDNYYLNERKKWTLRQNGSIVKSPIDQALKYKNNLYDLHVPDLLEEKINDIRRFNIVSCAIYFHCATQCQIEDLLVNPYKNDKKYQSFLKYNIDFIGRNNLNEKDFRELLKNRYLIARCPSMYFTEGLYKNFSRILAPPLHMRSEGIPYNYSNKQKEIIYSPRLEQRVKGVFGSGKTTVLAARAVQAYKRALERNHNPRILILTYNITLKNFIHDKLNRVDETFQFENFIIINYHQFINAELNNLNVEIVVPEETEIRAWLQNQYKDSYFTCDEKKIKKLISKFLDVYFEKRYYGNVQLFEKYKSQIIKYDAVLIDEIQDYHRAWMEIVKNYFRDPMGDYVLFGDVKQNIYGQPTEKKDVVTNVKGVNELKYCFRSEFKVRDLAQSFQKNIFKEKYEVDDFIENGGFDFFGQRQEKEGYINYMYLSGRDIIQTLYNIIRGNILNKSSNIPPNDITILGYTTNLLRLFDCYYRYASREKTNCMLEDVETMYMTHLNYIGKNSFDNPNKKWFDNITSHFIKKLFPNRSVLYNNDFIKLRKSIADLFTIYDLTVSFKDVFNDRLKEECDKLGITYEAFIAFQRYYSAQLSQFKSEVYNDNYKIIRDNKKIHFWMNSGTVKISTINSFKGWESEVVFLILEPRYDNTNDFNMSFDELLYTGLTRCRRNLVVINFGNKEYDMKIRPLINAIK